MTTDGKKKQFVVEFLDGYFGLFGKKRSVIVSGTRIEPYIFTSSNALCIYDEAKEVAYFPHYVRAYALDEQRTPPGNGIARPVTSPAVAG